MYDYQNDFIRLSLSEQALQFGEFTLKSGRQSPYFFNAGKFATGAALALLGECYAKAILRAEFEFDVLFGPAYKGIPLACATAVALSKLGRNTPYCFNRKVEKDHGEGGVIVGAPLRGRVLIIDDVITAGTAIKQSVKLIEQAGATPVGVIVALDRQESVSDEKKSAVQWVSDAFHIPVTSIINLQDLITHIKQMAEQKQPDLLNRLEDYWERYA